MPQRRSPLPAHVRAGSGLRRWGERLVVVVGSAPGWGEPWSRTRLAYIEQDANGWWTRLVDEDGFPIDEAEVQRARLSVALH